MGLLTSAQALGCSARMGKFRRVEAVDREEWTCANAIRHREGACNSWEAARRSPVRSAMAGSWGTRRGSRVGHPRGTVARIRSRARRLIEAGRPSRSLSPYTWGRSAVLARESPGPRRRHNTSLCRSSRWPLALSPCSRIAGRSRRRAQRPDSRRRRYTAPAPAPTRRSAAKRGGLSVGFVLGAASW